MAGRLIAIGDIHGCANSLAKLLAEIRPTTADTLVTLGDYVDRGPDSKGVIDQLIALREQCQLVAIQGNHEEMMLDVVKLGKPHARWLQYGGVETLDSYGFVGDLKVIPPEHHAFFDSMVDFYESERHFFVHANYVPDKPLSGLDPYVLRWQKLTDSMPGPHASGKKGVIGHTHDVAGQIVDVGHFMCIDTYCYGGGWLTAIEVESGEIWQANEMGDLQHHLPGSDAESSPPN